MTLMISTSYRPAWLRGVLLATSLIGSSAWASSCTTNESPLPLVKQAAEATLQHMCQGDNHSASHLVKAVRQDFLPIVNEQAMSEAVVGHRIYSSASASDQKAFTDVFLDSVFNTYASSIYSFCGAKMQFYPLRVNPETRQRIIVKSAIESDAGNQVTINYVTEKQDCHWQITDLNVANVSMVDSYHAQFATIAEQEGLASLTAKLNAKLGQDHS